MVYLPGVPLTFVSTHVSEFKTVLEHEFHAVNSEFQVLDSGFFVNGIWIPEFLC